MSKTKPEVKKSTGTFGSSGRDNSKVRESSLNKQESTVKNDKPVPKKPLNKPMSKTMNENLPPKIIKREPDKILTKSSAQIAKEQIDSQTKVVEIEITKRIERNKAFIDKLKSMDKVPPYAKSIL